VRLTSVFHERHRRFLVCSMVRRTLLEFQSTDEHLWIYFDSQSNHIMERMNSEHSSSIKVVEGMKTSFFSSQGLRIGCIRVFQRLCGTANHLLPRSFCRSNYKMRCHFSKRRRTTCCWVCGLHLFFLELAYPLFPSSKVCQRTHLASRPRPRKERF